MNEALWALGRGTGVVALVLLTTSLVLGVAGRSGRDLLGLGRFGVAEIHRLLALSAAGFVVVHLGSLLFDPYAQLRVVDLVVPFLGAYRPVWLGLGTLGVDLIAVLVVVSLLRHRVGAARVPRRPLVGVRAVAGGPGPRDRQRHQRHQCVVPHPGGGVRARGGRGRDLATVRVVRRARPRPRHPHRPASITRTPEVVR